jgi:hypothetical protein
LVVKQPVLEASYSFLPFENITKPIVPNASPVTEAPHDKKFKKKVDSRILMAIKKCKAIPNSIRTTPRIRSKRGEFISFTRSLMELKVYSGVRLGRCHITSTPQSAALRLEVWRKFDATQTCHQMWTTRMEAASRGRDDEAGWPTRSTHDVERFLSMLRFDSREKVNALGHNADLEVSKTDNERFESPFY